MGFSRFGFTPIIPLMQRDLSVSSWEIALMASANYLGYMVGAYASRQAFVRSNLRAGLGFDSCHRLAFSMRCRSRLNLFCGISFAFFPASKRGSVRGRVKRGARAGQKRQGRLSLQRVDRQLPLTGMLVLCLTVMGLEDVLAGSCSFRQSARSFCLVCLIRGRCRRSPLTASEPQKYAFHQESEMVCLTGRLWH